MHTIAKHKCWAWRKKNLATKNENEDGEINPGWENMISEDVNGNQGKNDLTKPKNWEIPLPIHWEIKKTDFPAMEDEGIAEKREGKTPS